MKTLRMFFWVSALVLCLAPLKTHAKIVETHCLSDILTEIDSDTLVLFDLDDTLINTPTMLGNTLWWNYFIPKVSSAGLSDHVRPEIYAVIHKIIQKVPIGLIEGSSKDIIWNLQNQGITILALTARSHDPDYMPKAGQFTYQQLKALGIDFSRTSLPHLSDENIPHFFNYGIIFTSHQEKGPFLKNFLDKMGKYPGKVVFIDDNLKQLKSVESSLEAMRIPFFGFRYGRLDNFHTQFDRLVANIQLEALLKKDLILSDDIAKKMAENNSQKDSDYYINHLIQEWRAKEVIFGITSK